MPADLTTLAERSGFRRTGRTDEVEALCAEFARRWPDAVHSFEYGRSAEGRPLRAMIVSRAAKLSPTQLRARNVPLLMLQGGIHPGESDGKDAGFIALREMLEGRTAPGALEKIAILFVPAFNTDGHERVGRWNRPNQRGPEETGWRVNANNLNLNRDYTKADSPEMRAMLRLINEWDPLLCADLHVTDGADFEHDISLQAEPLKQGDPALFATSIALRDELIAKLARQGSLPLPFYPDLAQTDDPSGGFLLVVLSPRFSTGYYPARNRFTVLVETHSWKDYATRVTVTLNTIRGLVEMTAADGTTWLRKAAEADESAARLGGKPVTVGFGGGWREPARAGTDASPSGSRAAVPVIDFRGYAYTRTPSPISGALVTTYDPSKPQIWRTPLHDDTQPSVIVTAPRLGYVIPAGLSEEIGARLALHGIRFERLEQGMTAAAAEVFRASSVKFSAAPFEGRMRATLEGDWQNEKRDVPPGSLLVPIAQPLARLAMALLEPRAPDSFAAWGFFNASFEQKEQLEPYVAEIIAREMLEREPSLAREFERRLAEDHAFAVDPAARLEFFLRRHESWDEQLNLYPILRLNG